MCHFETSKHLVYTTLTNTINNEPLGAKGPPLVGEEVCKKDVGKVES
jgi:hypothetical protein